VSFRSAAAALLLLVVFFASVPLVATAQTAAPGPATQVEVEDKENDVMLNAGTRAGVPPQTASGTPINTDHLDITGVFFGAETEKEFQIHLRLKALDATQTPFPVGFAMRAVTFAYGDVDWQVRVGACQGGQAQAEVAGCLGFRDGGARDFRSHITVAAEKDTSSKAFVFTIPKDQIFNQDRVPGRFGAEISNISARTYQWYGGLFFFPGGQGDPTGGVQAVDVAPDSGVVDEVFTFAQGSGSHGHLALSSNEPIRVSNGEATTIVYKVDLFNDADKPVNVELSVDGVRKDWSARVPALIKLEAQSSLTFPVILALPFTHEHGMTASFTVKARDVADTNSYSAVDLGVFWTDVPQPSAHHNGQLWFHSAPVDSDNAFFSAVPQVGGFYSGWINSIEDDPDPAATDANIGGFPGSSGVGCFFGQGGPTACGVPPENRINWFFPLSPKLLIGLDFEVGRPGRLVVDILPKVSATSAQLSAQLLYCDPDAEHMDRRGGLGNDNNNGPVQCNQYTILLASGFTTRALTANSAAQFEIPLSVEEAADLLPYKSGANIGLRLSLVTDTPQTVFGTEPRPEFVTKSGELYLPLNEYHDPVAAEFQNVGSLKLEPLSGFEKQVNPGETALFSFNLTNTGKTEQEMLVELEGINHEWATLVTEREFKLPAGGTKTLTISVLPPVDAQETESAELFLVAHSPADESIVTVTRLRATVVTGTDVPDEGAALSVEKTDTPGLGPAAVFLAIGSLVVLRRRKD
jgi:hypothetical protein